MSLLRVCLNYLRSSASPSPSSPLKEEVLPQRKCDRYLPFSVPTPHARSQKNTFPAALGPGCRNMTWACWPDVSVWLCFWGHGGLVSVLSVRGAAERSCLGVTVVEGWSEAPGLSSWGLRPVASARIFIGPDPQGGLSHRSCSQVHAWVSIWTPDILSQIPF